MREIVLDTETTGLDPKSGNRIVEIGCVEMVNQIATGETYHTYINPERDMPEQAFAVHGLSEEFLSGHPVFADVAEAFLAFIDDSTLVIHNAEFDMGFINAELARLDLAPVPMDLLKLQWERLLWHIREGTVDGYSILGAVLIDGQQQQANWVRDFISANS